MSQEPLACKKKLRHCNRVRSLYQYIFTKLKTLWDEFEALVPPPGCDCEKARGFFDYLKRHKLYKFLMGLNELFEKARSEILLMSHVPTVNQAYTMVVNDECQKVTSSRSWVGLSSVTDSGVDPMVIYSRTSVIQGLKM